MVVEKDLFSSICKTQTSQSSCRNRCPRQEGEKKTKKKQGLPLWQKKNSAVDLGHNEEKTNRQVFFVVVAAINQGKIPVRRRQDC